MNPKMKELMTDELKKQLPPLYATENVPLEAKQLVVKYSS